MLGRFHSQRVSNAEKLSISWRHHGWWYIQFQFRFIDVVSIRNKWNIFYSWQIVQHTNKKAWMRHITDPLWWESPVLGRFHLQRISNAENVSISWRHHGWLYIQFRFRFVDVVLIQNGRYFAIEIFRCIFLKINFCVPVQTSQKFVPGVKLTESQHWFV